MEKMRKRFWDSFLNDEKDRIADKLRVGPYSFRQKNLEVATKLTNNFCFDLDAIITPAIVSYMSKRNGTRNTYQSLFSNGFTKALEELIFSESKTLEKIYQSVLRFRLDIDLTLERVYKDWERLAEEFSILKSDYLSEIVSGAGDSHGFGNRTSIFKFNSGIKGFVYKPICLEIDTLLNDLKYFICEKRTTEKPNKVIKFSNPKPFSSYGYSKLIIGNSHAKSMIDVQNAFKEFGKLLAFGKIFNISDGHYENIIVDAPRVHWIDMEMGFNYFESVEANHPIERTGLLFEARNENTILGIPTGMQSGIIPRIVITKPSVIDDGKETMNIRFFRIARPSTNNRIYYEGKPCRPENFTSFICSGYEEFYASACRKKKQILENCLTSFEKTEIRTRYIFQLTACYARYIALINHCQSHDKDNILRQIQKERSNTFHSSELKAKDFVLNCELSDICNGVIPYFYRSSRSKSIYHLSGMKSTDFFSKNLLEIASKNINKISANDLPGDLDFINKALQSTKDITCWEDFKKKFNPPAFQN